MSVGLVAPDGRDLPLRLHGEPAAGPATRVLSLTRRMRSETDFGRQDAFQSLWSSMEELLLTYNERPFVSEEDETPLEVGSPKLL